MYSLANAENSEDKRNGYYYCEETKKGILTNFSFFWAMNHEIIRLNSFSLGLFLFIINYIVCVWWFFNHGGNDECWGRGINIKTAFFFNFIGFYIVLKSEIHTHTSSVSGYNLCVYIFFVWMPKVFKLCLKYLSMYFFHSDRTITV